MELRKQKKGMYFLIDAILFSTLLLLALLTIQPLTETKAQNIQLTSFASDMTTVLEELKVSEVNSLLEAELLANNSLSEENMSVLFALGELWAKNKSADALNLLNQTFGDVIPSYQSFGIYIENDPLLERGVSNYSDLVSGWRIISGIDKDKPVRGFVANARATAAEKNTTQIVSISPVGAGWHRGNTIITKYFEMDNVTITDTLLRLSLHADQTDSAIQVSVNGCDYVRNDLTWQYGSSEGNVGEISVDGCVVEGWNKIELRLQNRWYNAHTHPGLQLILNYSEEIVLIEKTNVTQRYYFENIVSEEYNDDRSGVWAMMPFTIPDSAVDLNVTIQIAGRNVYDYISYAVSGCTRYISSCYSNWFQDWNNAFNDAATHDYLLFLNDNQPFDIDGSPSLNPLYVYNYTDIQSELVFGTNIVAVYFNNYRDIAWGEGDVQLYSDPITDPNGSSFVEVSYTYDEPVEYGQIEVSEIIEFGSPDDNDKTVSFSYPSGAVRKSDVFVHLIQQFSSRIYQYADPFSPPSTQIFESPSTRAIPSTVYVDPSHFELSPTYTNYIRTRDEGSGNLILDSSTLEYRYYINSFVDYGEVFLSQENATADALQRLEDQIGLYLDSSDIETASGYVSGVPSLWGPAKIEVRAWE